MGNRPEKRDHSWSMGICQEIDGEIDGETEGKNQQEDLFLCFFVLLLFFCSFWVAFQ